MQKCAICDKELWGHALPKKGPIICGSCTLKKKDAPEGAPRNQSMFEVRMNMAKLVFNPVQLTNKGTSMEELKVRSNFARNRTILLDGKYGVTFDGQGIARIPGNLTEAFNREMAARPGRYTILETVKLDPQPEVTPTVQVPVEDKETKLPVQLDFGYLLEDVTRTPEDKE